MKRASTSIFLTLALAGAMAKTLRVGTGQTYTGFAQAAANALPGDTILFKAGTYNGGEFFANLQGTSDKPILVMAAQGENVVHTGGSNGFQVSDAAYIKFLNLIFEKQTGNGFNLDDAGTIATPAHHITFENCVFRNMNASGNNDLLKLSGLDYFEIKNCHFVNGALGGSGIDMVGCHHGLISQCKFENMGSNAIQAKGGCQFLKIEGNFFKNCGQRTLNLGGSTGLSFFRPIDATFEASDIAVHSNVIIGSVAPIAYVGCQRVEVVNNTIYKPEKWVLRILQETVDTTRFIKCGNNVFRNNLIYRGNAVSIDCNVGGNTNPQSFLFSNNLWYHYENATWSGPGGLPTTDLNQVKGLDPLFANLGAEDFSIPTHSPAVEKGYKVSAPKFDYSGMAFSDPRSIGAFEGKPSSGSFENLQASKIRLYPQPITQCATIEWDNGDKKTLVITDIQGKEAFSGKISSGDTWCPTNQRTGVYFYRIYDENMHAVHTGKFYFLR